MHLLDSAYMTISRVYFRKLDKGGQTAYTRNLGGEYGKRFVSKVHQNISSVRIAIIFDTLRVIASLHAIELLISTRE